MGRLLDEDIVIDIVNFECGKWTGLSKTIEKEIKELPSAQPDLIAKIQNGINATNANDSYSCGMRNGMRWVLSLVDDKEPLFENCPSAQPERRCVNCGRTVNNGGWYKDGRTRCPIEEHYALPKDGYCHLWEKRNVTDDDYPERREE